MAPTDDELIHDYTRTRSSAAFATLVERHLNLVYSVARRHVRSGALAEEVAQAVFVDLARDAARLKPDTPLIAWLHVVARRTAIDVARRETRRQAREVEAAQLAETMKTPEPAWAEVEPLLDEAVESLAPADRTAILLRFFENKSLRDVGAALGTSDDAAQKRVSRAVDELRAFFQHRGIAISATALAGDLATHTLHTAPTGLASAIAHAAVLTGTGTAAAMLETSRVLVMTSLQKSLAVAAFVVVGGAGVYESAVAARQDRDLSSLREQNNRTVATLRTLRAERAAAAVRLKTVEQQIDARLAQARAVDPTEAATVTEMTNWLTRLDRVQELLAQRPQLNTPEMQYLTKEQWFVIAGGRALDTDEDFRRLVAQLRATAENPFSARFSTALKAYVDAHDGRLPASPHELAPYLDPPVDVAILDRWTMLQTGRLADLAPRDRLQTMAPRTPPDPEFDSYIYAGPNGHGSTSAAGINMVGAWQAFAKEHPGERPTSATQLKPYLKWPMSDAAVQKYLETMGSAMK